MSVYAPHYICTKEAMALYTVMCILNKLPSDYTILTYMHLAPMINRQRDTEQLQIALNT